MQQLDHVTGLRSYAVVVVLLFHLGVEPFSGGFVGVDAFFVISGFLITGKLTKDVHAAGSINVLEFYAGRIRRIYPALLITLALTFIASTVLLSPEHLKPAANSVIAAATSMSNILFWQESGYFDVSKGTKPLLHTWSLGVEMQFYLLWPLILAPVLRYARQLTLFVIAVLAFVSFGANYLFEGDSLFFLTPFRIFEFAIGALLVWTYDRRRAPAWASSLGVVVGMAMLLYPVFFYDGTEAFPRHYALLPCVGTALLVQFGYNGVGRLLLENRPAVFLGKISYSLYLVHWPLIVLYQYWDFGADLVPGVQLVLGVASVALATALYFFVETPTRAWALGSMRTFAATMVAVAAMSVPAANAAADGWADRQEAYYPANVRQREVDLDKAAAEKCRIEVGLQGDCDMMRARKILVLGDSHLRAMSYALQETLPDVQFVNLSYLGCHGALSVEGGNVVSTTTEGYCQQKADFINQNPDFFLGFDVIVLASYRPFSYHANTFRFDLLDHVAGLARQGGDVSVLVFGNYFQTDPSRPCSQIVQRRRSVEACMEDEFIVYVGTAEQVATEALHKEHGAKYEFVDIAKMFCPSLTGCPGHFDGAPFLFDANHLTPTFATHLVRSIVESHAPYFREVGLIVGDAERG